MRKSFFKAPVLSGPVFERSRDGMIKVVTDESAGSHYSVYHFDYRRLPGGGVEQDSVLGMESFRDFMKRATEHDEVFVLFGTSGVHGSYISLDDIEECIERNGEDPIDDDDKRPSDYVGRDLTVLIIQTRLVCMRCGNVRVTKADIPYLKEIRDLSRQWAMGYFE